jgi:signal transduction histidine kinase
MEQPHLEKELVRRTRRLSALYTVLTAYHQVNDLDELMKLALSQVLTITAGSVGSIHLFDETGESLHLAAHQGMSASVVDVLWRIPAKDNITSDILARKESLIITEMTAEPRLVELAQISGWDVFIGVPIVNGKTVWGVLSIYGDKTLQATAEEIELLGIISSQIGIAIENSHLREQAERLAIAEERNRLARELHDSVTQSLYSLTLFAETAKRMMEAGDQAGTRRCLDEIADSSQQALKEMRLLVYKLRPSTYTEGGLSASLEQRLRAVEGRSGVKYDFKADNTLSIRPEVENALYAVAVEVLNNALKYAQADHVRVELSGDGEAIYLKISDNGCGFELDRARQSGGLGLASIQERVSQLAGTIKINTAPEDGTIIQVWLPNKLK